MKELTFPPNWKQVPSPGSKRYKRSSGPYIVTPSEIQSYQRCRRAWDFTSANRQSLYRQGLPIAALNIGSCVHYALAQHWRGRNWLEAVNEHYEATLQSYTDFYTETVGAPPSDQELNVLFEQRNECQYLVGAYYDRYGHDNPTKPYRIVASEITFRVPLDSEYDIWLAGTIDRVFMDEDGSIGPIEIKTYRSAPKRDNWSFNFQVHAYAIALQLLTRQPVRLALYDGIRKKGPTEPDILKSGKVSKKWIDTTAEMYKNTVLRAHEGELPAEYLDIINRLRARDRSPMNAFVHRFRVPLYKSALDQVRWTMKVAAREMAYYPIIVPSKDWQGCTMCRVKDLCDATYRGEPLDSLIAMNYRVDKTPTRRVDESRIATVDKIRSLDDLIQFAAELPHDPLGRHRVGSLEE